MAELIRITGQYPTLQIQDYGGYQTRNVATLAFLKECFARYARELDSCAFNFCVYTGDNPDRVAALADRFPFILAYAVADGGPANILPMPDFIYQGWPEAGFPSYDEVIRDLMRAGDADPQNDKMFWIGSVETYPSRQALIEIGQQNPDTMDFVAMQWRQSEEGGALVPTPYVTLPDHARYAYLLDMRGAGYSGRLKILMHAKRPVFIIERLYKEFFYPMLRPDIDYVAVKDDLSDLAQKLAAVKRDPVWAQNLAINARGFAEQYLTRDYALMYMRDLLLKIAVSSSHSCSK